MGFLARVQGAIEGFRRGTPASWSDIRDEISRHYAEYPVLPPTLPENVERLATLERDGIVFIENKKEQNKHHQLTARTGPKNKSVSSLVAGFKSAVTKKINETSGISGVTVWQRNYHEHIIRNEESLTKIRGYVMHNPQTWEKDSLFSL